MLCLLTMQTTLQLPSKPVPERPLRPPLWWLMRQSERPSSVLFMGVLILISPQVWWAVPGLCVSAVTLIPDWYWTAPLGLSLAMNANRWPCFHSWYLWGWGRLKHGEMQKELKCGFQRRRRRRRKDEGTGEKTNREWPTKRNKNEKVLSTRS